MRPLIIANWKCNPASLAQAKQLFVSIKKGTEKIKEVEVVVCPPFVYLSDLGALGSQDVFCEGEGAFTGEISPKMLKGLGVRYAIVGHSERRKYQKETDETINKKVKAALKEKLRVILCIDKVSQLGKDLKGVSGKELKNLIVAFEPLFAIGTGKPCSAARAGKIRASIRKILKNTPVLYGGSVNSQNAGDYIKKAGFQGLLVGGASLNPEEFIRIAKNAGKP